MADMPQAQANIPLKKFMFERSFDLGGSQPVERKPVTLKPEQVDQLKKDAFDAGIAAGRKQQMDEQDQQLTAMLVRIEERLAAAIAYSEALHTQMEIQLRQLALAVTGRLLPDYIAKHGTGEINALLTQTIGEMLHEPRLVVRVHDSQFDAINVRVHDITVQKAYAGKVIVLADAELATGDCRIEWADGGVERNAAASWAEIKTMVAPAALS